MSPERRCPLCGSPSTEFGTSFSDGEEWVTHPFLQQECANNSCGLPCQLWDKIQQLIILAQPVVESAP